MIYWRIVTFLIIAPYKYSYLLTYIVRAMHTRRAVKTKKEHYTTVNS